MKQAFKCLSLAILLSVPSLDAANSCNTSCSSSCDSNNNSVVTCIVPRSQGRNKYVQVAGSVGHTHLYDMESWYASFSITPEYTQTFRPKNITQCLFGPFVTQTPASTTVSSNSCDSNCKTSCSSRSVLVQGSGVANRSSNALVADNFYLPSDYSSVLTFSPRIRNILVNFDLYIGLDEWLSGLYFRIYGPVTNTRWDLNFCETPVAAGTDGYDAGVFASGPLTTSNLLTSFAAYSSGNSPQTVDGVTFNGLQASQILQCQRRHTGFADLRFELGWDFWMCDDYHLGVNIQAAAPTGTKKKAGILFDYVIGNDKGELGGGLTGHYVFWRNESEDSHFGFYLDANVTHLFKSSECRVFDLKGKPLSRYLLAEKMTSPVTNDLLAGGNTPNAQFANEFTPVANLTTQEVDVSIGAQGEIVAMFNFTWCGFSWDIGYDFWGRSCEKIKEDCDCVNAKFKDTKWALKGNAQVYGFVETPGNVDLPTQTPVALSATQSKATINGIISNAANIGVDNAAIATANPTAGAVDLITAPQTVAGTAINTSSTAVFIKADDIDFGQRTRGISNMIFTHLSYTWDRECWVPYLGVGAMAEFGKHEGSNCNDSSTTISSNSSCSSCLDCAVSQWGVWVKGGISFN